MATYYVRIDGDDGNGGTDPDTDAKLTIASAYGVATDDDTIDIGEGTWTENLQINVKNITYQGAGMFKTTINGGWSGAGSGFNKQVTQKDFKMVWQENAVENGTPSTYRSSGQQTHTWERVYLDFNNYGGTVGRIFYCDRDIDVFVFRKSILCNYASAGASDTYFISATGDSKWHFLNTIIYNIMPNSYFLRAQNNVKIVSKNSIFMTMENIDAIDNSTWTSTYDCFYDVDGAEADVLTDKTGTIFVDPKFVNAAGGDFSLQSDSPCLATGQP